jgi:TonB family protein
MTFSTLALLVALSQAQAPGAPPADLASVRALYAAAAYDEALSHLGTIKDPSLAEQVEQYRALCFLALGRTDEAERALARIVAAKPMFRVNESDVSPRLVTLFADVRRRELPGVAKRMFTNGRAAFDAKNYGTARDLFASLAALVKDDDLSTQDAIRDMAVLADGFLRLSEAALEPPKAAAPPPPPPVEAPATTKPVPPTVYSIEDKDVVPPADIERRLPTWDPSNPVIAASVRRGVLEVIINERGSVESAVLRSPVSPHYDDKLIDAAKKWKFKPATKDGKPVKFRRLFAISLTGSDL